MNDIMMVGVQFSNSIRNTSKLKRQGRIDGFVTFVLLYNSCVLRIKDAKRTWYILSLERLLIICVLELNMKLNILHIAYRR